MPQHGWFPAPADCAGRLLYRYQLGRRVASLLAPREAAHKMLRPWRIKLLAIGTIIRRLEALASGEYSPDRNLPTVDHNHPDGLFQECTIPTPRLQTPRPHEDAILNHHRPDANHAVRFRPRVDPKNLTLANGSNNIIRKTSLRFHLLHRAILKGRKPRLLKQARPSFSETGIPANGRSTQQQAKAGRLRFEHHLTQNPVADKVTKRKSRGVVFFVSLVFVALAGDLGCNFLNLIIGGLIKV